MFCVFPRSSELRSVVSLSAVVSCHHYSSVYDHIILIVSFHRAYCILHYSVMGILSFSYYSSVPSPAFHFYRANLQCVSFIYCPHNTLCHWSKNSHFSLLCDIFPKTTEFSCLICFELCSRDDFTYSSDDLSLSDYISWVRESYVCFFYCWNEMKSRLSHLLRIENPWPYLNSVKYSVLSKLIPP